MDIWNVERIADRLEQLDIAVDREAMNLARWIWEDILAFDILENKLLSAGEEIKLNRAIDRAHTGEPMQYIVGHAWFYGYTFKVNRDVLIPRPETEELVEWILEDYKKLTKPVLRILDIGTGSGCIALVLKKKLGERADISALDISEKALQVARENSEILGAKVEFHTRDFLSQGFKDLGQFDIIVSNPPYVSQQLAGDKITFNLRYEPQVALYPSGGDPDIFYKKISQEAGSHLTPEGCCFIELNEFRAQQIEAYFVRQKWKETEIRIDLQGLPRMMKARFT
jgi:release factor glutamine methyltransferase